MTTERRQHPRTVVSLDCHWDGCTRLSPSRLSDISLGGCYVDSGVSLPVIGQTVELTVMLNGVLTTLRGTVTQVHSGMGFGLEFAGLDEAALVSLRAFLASHDSMDRTA